MNNRTIERILLAAANCHPIDERQAAIIGGIAQSLIATGHFQPHAAAAIAAENMGWAYTTAINIDKSIDEQGYAGPVVPPLPNRMFPKDRRGYPSMPEVREAAAMFKRHYDPPPSGVRS